jgi:hypothetical protein
MPDVAASGGRARRAKAMQIGHEFTKMPIAVAISLFANRSVTIFDMSTLRRTPPTPLRRRPANCQDQPETSAMTRPPLIMRTRPDATSVVSP